ncbi:histone-like nucleoid-structuring protein Lsr2 [Nocardia asteroides]|uniref:histone-like nucleoid-structuring protein Lsr2 n=1 Tax=Nocardia asteroides TaxID=1824 RepID=UPI00365EE9C1
MARKVVVTLIDDFDGTSVAEETVAFEFDGVAYEIDLSSANAAALRESFDEWIAHARKIGRAKNSTRRSEAKAPAKPAARRNDLSAIRAWASENGHAVSTRGRISADIIAAYEKASAA